MRTCKRCGEVRPMAEFRYRTDKRLHVTSCKPCERKAQLVYYQQAKHRDPVKWRVQTLRNNRSKHITLEWLEAKLEQQHHRCALSGRPISILTLEVDHIIPRCEGGSDELANLRLLCRDANAAKGALSDEELFQLCRDIIGRAILAAEQAA